MGIHGGDIYRNEVKLDFSVNVNPLGTPESVVAALHGAVERCGNYPDMKAEKLKRAVSLTYRKNTCCLEMEPQNCLWR